MNEENPNGNPHHIPRKRRKYSDQDRAAALVHLAYNNGNCKEVERITGIPDSTIAMWRDGFCSEVVPELRDEKSRNLADTLEELAFKLAEKLGNNEKNSGIDLGIVVDKMLLLRGDATSITKDVSHADPEARKERILHLVEKAKKVA